MIVTRKSPFSGVENRMDVPVTEAELSRLEAGELIQAVVPPEVLPVELGL